MGKFIYIMDAYEDIGDDVKKKSYNPLIQLMHLSLIHISTDMEGMMRIIEDKRALEELQKIPE